MKPMLLLVISYNESYKQEQKLFIRLKMMSLHSIIVAEKPKSLSLWWRKSTHSKER